MKSEFGVPVLACLVVRYGARFPLDNRTLTLPETGPILLMASNQDTCGPKAKIIEPIRMPGKSMQTPSWLSELKSIFGAEHVLTDEADLLSLSYDATPLLERLPRAAVRPRHTEQLIALVQLANQEGFALVPRGSGTGLSGGSIPAQDSVVILFPEWNHILEIDEANLTALVEPGVITGELHRAVESRGLFYPPDPGSLKICTIGGNVAENSGGLRGLKYGVTGDYVLGIEAVLPNGDYVNVGNKCVKDVAGLRLKELFIGSEGILGLFTRILLKLIPRPAETRTMVAYFETMGAAAETVSEIIAQRIIPCTLEFLDETTIRCVEDFAHVGLPRDIQALLLIEVDGHPAVVAEEAEAVAVVCRKHGCVHFEQAHSADEAERLKTARRAALSALARLRPTTILEDVTVPRSQVAPMIEHIQRIAREFDLVFGTFGHAGDGNLHPTCLTDARDARELQRVEKAFEAIFRAAVDLGGTITGEHGIGLAKKRIFHELTPGPTLELMLKLKAVLDPNNILNPGKLIEPRPRCETLHAD